MVLEVHVHPYLDGYCGRIEPTIYWTELLTDDCSSPIAMGRPAKPSSDLLILCEACTEIAYLPASSQTYCTILLATVWHLDV